MSKFSEKIFRGETPLETDPNGVWEFFKNTYFVGMLPPTEKAEIRQTLVAMAQKHADASGRLKFSEPLKRFTVVRK